MRAVLMMYGLVALVLSLVATAASIPSGDLIDRDNSNQTQLSLDESEHEYRFQEFQPRSDPNASFRQPYFRFDILFRRKAGITEEFLNRHWKTVHADLTLSQTDFSVHVQRYVQFHQDEEHRKEVQRLVDAVGGAMQLAPYDGFAEFHAKDYESFEKFILSVFADPIIVEDQNKFSDGTAPLHIMAGYDNLIFGGGIKTSNGYDGILPGDPRFKCSR